MYIYIYMEMYMKVYVYVYIYIWKKFYEKSIKNFYLLKH